MEKISVIVPVYNAKNYVRYCIDGLLSQSFSDTKIIVVDDCSTDGSFELLDELYKDNPRVEILRQEKNGGPATARNTGMEHAKGEYITFVDCDDAIVRDAFEKLYELAAETHADVIHTIGCLIPVKEQMPDDLFSVEEDDLFVNIQDNNPPQSRHIVSDDIKTRVDEWLEHRYQGNVWGKLFRRKFLEENNIRFANLKLSEDQIFCFECLLYAKVYVQVPWCLNIYRIAGESLSRGKKNSAYMTRVLRSMFEASKEIASCMDRMPFFLEHPEYVQRVHSYTQGVMEDMFVRPSYSRTSRKEMMEDMELHNLWEEFYGENACWVERMFYELHDLLPEVPDLMGDMNTYEFWKMVKDNAG